MRYSILTLCTTVHVYESKVRLTSLASDRSGLTNLLRILKRLPQSLVELEHKLDGDARPLTKPPGPQCAAVKRIISGVTALLECLIHYSAVCGLDRRGSMILDWRLL